MTQTCGCGKRQAPASGGCGCGGRGGGGCGGGGRGGCGCGGGSQKSVDPRIKDRSEGRPQLDIRSGI